ncbi:thermonuclease family protein [Palleronia sp. KMU-117]|uniref:thermonuclease family protein n=1 Tax=Palleronia sp. KMU-117 TaxID=3434108 RepID=UPI003D70EA00
MLRMILRALRRSRRPDYPMPSAPAPTPKPKVVHLPPRKVQDPPKPDRTPPTNVLKGKCRVVDGDTIIISGTSIRIAGIDAPELHHPWGKKARFAMIDLCKGKVVTAVILPEVSYDRIVARCYLEDGTDLAAELVKQGLALDWPKFSGGAYRHLEPEGIRKKHWRAAAKQQGRLPASEM